MRPLKMPLVLFQGMVLFSILSSHASLIDEQESALPRSYRVLSTDFNRQINNRLEILRFSSSLLLSPVYPEIPVVALWSPSSSTPSFSLLLSPCEETENDPSSSPSVLLPNVVETYDNYETPAFCSSPPIEGILKSLSYLAIAVDLFSSQSFLSFKT